MSSKYGICWIIIMLYYVENREPLTVVLCKVTSGWRTQSLREPPASYPLVFYIANWKITIFKFGKSWFSSFVSMGHGFHSKLLNNQRVMNHFVVGAYILSLYTIFIDTYRYIYNDWTSDIAMLDKRVQLFFKASTNRLVLQFFSSLHEIKKPYNLTRKHMFSTMKSMMISPVWIRKWLIYTTYTFF